MKRTLAHEPDPTGVAGVTLLVLLAAAFWTAGAAAQGWKPTRNVELIVPGGTGGGQDRTARIMQQILQAGLVPTNVLVINHIAIALAAKAAGVDARKLKTVVYKASIEATTALMGGHVDVVATPTSTYLPVLGTGKIRIVAVAAPRRVGGKFAGVPTWREQGYDTVMPSFRMLIGAKALDAAQLRYWDATIARLAASPEWKKELQANEWQGSYMNSADSIRFLDAQAETYRGILAELGLAKR